MAYYFLLLSLPPLSFKAKPDLTIKELKELVCLNLSKEDSKKFTLLLRPIDLYNIRALWLELPLDERGNLGAKDLEEAILVGSILVPYLADYLDRYESISERLRNFSSLYVSFYAQAIADFKGFIHRYFQFERELMLLLLAFRAKRTGRDLVRELQFEDPTDPFVANILAQKDAADFVPPQEFEKLKILFVENTQDPEKLNRAILEYRFEKIEEIEQEMPPFSIDQVLGYVARFLVVDSWFQFDREKGRQAIEQLME